MLATPWDAPFSDDEWSFELKWDGVRCLLTSADGVVRLHSRAGNDMTARYRDIVDGVFPADVVLDGEIVALDQEGLPSFELLQSRMNLQRVHQSGKSVRVSYVVFDLLHRDRSLLRLPIEDRRHALNDLDLPASCVVAEQYQAEADPIWDFVTEHDLEGIVAKRIGSTYQPGVRSADWRKIGNFKQVRVVVGGFTRGSGGRAATFGALLVGLWGDGELHWVGAVGSGFNEKALVAIRTALDEMTVASSPFASNPELPDAATWVEPRLVAMVRFKQWTTAGRLRAPSFKGFTDTAPEAATWAAEAPESR
jgi:bifunctional non-homologous end joining protein LigD